MNKLIPNFTQVPNCFFDEIMPQLGHAEIKCLLYIIRRTYGFHRSSDRISLSQFESGISGLDKGTGLAKKNIYKALETLVDKNVIKKVMINNINSYSLVINDDIELGTQSNTCGYEEYQIVGTQSNTQKKEKEIEIKIYSHKDYLIKIPDTDLTELTQKYNCDRTQVIAKGDQMYHWLESNGKKYKNFRSLLMNALSRDYGLRQKANNAMMI